MAKEANIRPVEFFADVELPVDEQLNDIESLLSMEEERILMDILDFESQIEKRDFMRDMLDAVKKGAEDYLDAMTDTSETFDQMKRTKDVKKWDETVIERNNRPATIEENERMSPRTMSEANKSPFDHDAARTTNGMSQKGASRFAMHLEAYKQRTKSIVALSAELKGEKQTVEYKKNEKVNLSSLSGLRGYRVGIVVPMDPITEVQEAFQQDVKTKGFIDSKSNWIRNRNFNKFDDALVKEYGFKSRAEARKWRKENHLTIHESADGMILVPTDVHDKASHSGYCAQVAKLLKGEITKEQFDKSVVQEKISYVKHEAKQHAFRAAKGIGIDIVKEALRFSIVTVCKETYNEFHQITEDKFVQRATRVLNNCWQKLKEKYTNANFYKDRGIKGVVNELLVMLNDYFLGVFKKIFKLVRQMWGSIKSAFNIIRNKNYSWQEKMFEATKILSAGVVGVLGFSLNELIEKMLLAIPPIAPFASFISECFSGLIAGILSAIVLMLFDNMKAKYKSNNSELQLLQLKSYLTNLYTMQISLDSLKMDEHMLNAFQFFDMTFKQIQDTRERIAAISYENSILLGELSIHSQNLQEQNTNLSNLLNQIQDNDF